MKVSTPDDYQSTWQTYYKQVLKAEGVLSQCILDHAGTAEAVEVTLDSCYRAVTGTAPAVLCAVLNVPHPADGLLASHLVLLWYGLRATIASIEGWSVGGSQPDVPTRLDLACALQRLRMVEGAR